MIKLIAVGSRLMGDDGIAISVAEELKDPLDAMELIESEPEPGTLVVLTLDEAIFSGLKTFSQHEINLCTLLRLYGYKNKGFLIGIIVPAIDSKVSLLEIGDLNSKQFDELCKKVELLINDLTVQRV